MTSDLKVTIFGLGYIGLPTAALMASRGIRVQGIDTQAHVVDTINRGAVHIIEPDLDQLVQKVVADKLLSAHNVPLEADVYMIAVPTPVNTKHEPDMAAVEAVTDAMSPLLKEGDLVIIESTSPVGTTSRAYERILASRPELSGKLRMAYCPERVLPGNVLYELENNDRVVGGIDAASATAAKEVYARFVQGKIHETSAAVAEMCKLTENAYRDVNIAFANELSLVCDKAGIDVTELITLANYHPRVNILSPGVGVGGHCIAVDPWFIISEFPELTAMMRTARLTNDQKRDWVIRQIQQTAEVVHAQIGRKPVIACMGLAYKPNIDDLRESPALYITRQLVQEGYHVLAVEPHIGHHPDLELTAPEDALREADMVVYLVRHTAFTALTEHQTELDFCGLRG